MRSASFVVKDQWSLAFTIPCDDCVRVGGGGDTSGRNVLRLLPFGVL